MNWKKLSEEKPKNKQRCIVAILSRPDNARWSFGLADLTYTEELNNDGSIKRFDFSRDGYGYSVDEDDLWIPFPDPPELTPEQKAMSEQCYYREKQRKIEKLEKQLEEIKRS
jgi:hypothetical protein